MGTQCCEIGEEIGSAHSSAIRVQSGRQNFPLTAQKQLQGVLILLRMHHIIIATSIP